MGLQEEIDQKITEIKSDSYSMSIGELVNLYKDKEIEIHPEFQRFFRWTNLQKTKLIESILLGIPIPPIFVAQRTDGIWDVVDGVQRLSTIFQFIGILIDEDGKLLEPLVLEKTKYLPSLQGKKWDDSESYQNSLTSAQRLFIKRAKLDIKILFKESDEKTKYELFQRLNTGGSTLSDQEIRNCILVMENRNVYRWLRELAKNEDFKECVSLTDRSLEEQYDMELVFRFIVLRKIDEEELKKFEDLSEFLNDKAIEICRSSDFDFEEASQAFKYTFQILNREVKANSFRKYDIYKGKFTGGFLIPAFEVIALGIGYHHEKLHSMEDLDISSKIQELWKNETLIKGFAGFNASYRMRRTVVLGRQFFQE
ncbi:DUF262 domain-containing protein [Fischerella sp. PCC 9605]|uniref:DUF262 domain-containing protein n=1 Tax=Fischerella sp. PCC 9605 TaxID=1173024 RepID=UPI000478DC69|nr:DUF262 domain-containing protein [Fischerella sp. PCC 9605]